MQNKRTTPYTFNKYILLPCEIGWGWTKFPLGVITGVFLVLSMVCIYSSFYRCTHQFCRCEICLFFLYD